jgi:hypothetical protein
MYKVKRLKSRLMLLVSDPIPIDTEIARNEGTLVAIEDTSESLLAPRIA